jgi:hypothetical protein
MLFLRRYGLLSLTVAVVALLGALPATAGTAGYAVTITTPAFHPLTGSQFDISGAVSPAAPGEVVRLQRHVGGRFRTVGTQTLTSTSGYDFTRTLDGVGTYVFRVKKPSTALLGAGYSPRQRIFITSLFVRRSQVRAQSWVNAHVSYSQTSTYSNRFGTYRRDCSGYLSMAWHLSSSYTTATLPSVSYAIGKTDLRQGDLLLHLATPSTSGHAVMFAKWANHAHTSYVAYEESPSHGAVRDTIPYPYWDGNGAYAPYRRNGT